jgi:hypothetical protein
MAISRIPKLDRAAVYCDVANIASVLALVAIIAGLVMKHRWLFYSGLLGSLVCRIIAAYAVHRFGRMIFETFGVHPDVR